MATGLTAIKGDKPASRILDHCLHFFLISLLKRDIDIIAYLKLSLERQELYKKGFMVYFKFYY